MCRLNNPMDWIRLKNWFIPSDLESIFEDSQRQFHFRFFRNLTLRLQLNWRRWHRFQFYNFFFFFFFLDSNFTLGSVRFRGIVSKIKFHFPKTKQNKTKQKQNKHNKENCRTIFMASVKRTKAAINNCSNK